jgi:hypothetical protein
MRKAILTGLFTGLIISVILIGGTYLRRFLPHTFTANMMFFIFFFGSIVTVLWLSLNFYCKSSTVKWMSLGTTGVVASLIAALLVSLHGFLYSRFSDPAYLDEIMQVSKAKWKSTNAAAENIIGNWTWFQSSFDSALYNFRDLIVLLFVISLSISVIFYLIHRKRTPGDRTSEDHELIF